MTLVDRLTVDVTGVDLFDDYLCLRYQAAPPPDQLRRAREISEGPSAGVAIDGGHRVHSDCVSAYRVSADRSRVVGALKIGPVAWRDVGSVAVLFAPFAHTPELHGHLCEVRLEIHDGWVHTLSVRSA